MSLTAALAQIDPALGIFAGNVEKHCEAAERARQAGANIVLFPELSLTGYSIKDLHWDLALDPATPPAALNPLLEISRSVSIIAGCVEEGPGYGLYNAALLFEKGTVRTVHRKVYPPTYGMFEELRYFSPGRAVRAFDCGSARIGVLICEDLWHLSLPYLLAADGATAIFTLVASPTRVVGTEERLPIAVANSENHRAIARLLSVHLLFCNRVGFDDGVGFWGGSEVVGPDGEVLASAKTFDEDLITAVLDENDIRRARRFSRHFLDDDLRLVQDELRRIMKQREEKDL